MTEWRKEIDSYGQIIWRNKKDKDITIEAHRFDSEEAEELSAEWYVFPANKGKGIPNSPYLAINKKDALREIKRLKEVI
jgi:hypothetical protein